MANDPATPTAPQSAPAPAPAASPDPQLAAIGSAMQQSQPQPTPQGQPTDVMSPGNPAPPPAVQQGAQPVPVQPGTPHAGLVNMIQSLALGVDAFATAAATHGREGGVPEVQDYFAKQQQQKLQAEQAQREQTESDLRTKTMNANLLMDQMNYQHALMRFPTELKNDQLELQNNTIDAFTKERSTGESMGYDMADPAQAQEAKMRMGVGSAAQQPGAISVPFTSGQNTQDVMQSLSTALPAGKSLTDYKILPSYNDNAHGTGGTILAVPNNAPLMTMPATPRQVAASQAEVQGMVEKGQALGLTDNDQFKSLVGNFQNMKQVLDAGGKPTTSQLFQMHQSVIGPLSKMVADASDASKMAAQQQALQKETIAGQQQRAANNAYLRAVPKDANGQPTESFDTWQTAQNKAIEQSITEGDPKAAGAALNSGLITLADLKSRGSNPAQILRAINAASQLSGGTYNPSDEVIGEQALKNPTNQTFFGSARSLMTPQTGVLDQLTAAHASMPFNSKIPVLNSIKNVIDWETNSPQQAAYKAALLGAADDYSKVIGGGSPTDSARDSFIQIFNKNLSNGGIQSAVNAAKGTVTSQVAGRIGNNRYIQQREGDILSNQPQQPQQRQVQSAPAPTQRPVVQPGQRPTAAAPASHPFFSQFGGVTK